MTDDAVIERVEQAICAAEWSYCSCKSGSNYCHYSGDRPCTMARAAIAEYEKAKAER